MAQFTEQVAISLDLGQNQIKNLLIDVLSTEPVETGEHPAGSKAGRIYFNSTTKKYGVYLGSGEGLGWQYFATVAELTAGLNLKQNNISFETNSPLSFGTGDNAAQLKIALSTSIAAAESASDSKVATEKAVRTLHNGIPSETMTLTNKTFDANGTGNSISNIEVENLAQGVLVTNLATAQADDTTIPSAKAVQAAISAAQVEAMQYRGTWTLEKEEGATASQSTGSSLSGLAVVLATFKEAANPTASQNYVFTFDGTESVWKLGEETADLADYGITYEEGTPIGGDAITVAYVKGTTDFSGLSAYCPIYKGDFFAINGTGPVTIGGVEYNSGDHLIANTNMATADDLAGSKFDKIDNTEAADIVRLSAPQTITNKTINALDNTVSNLQLSNLKSDVLVTDLSSAQSTDTTIASAKAVQAAIAAAAPGVDNVTIELYDHTSGGGSDHDLRLKDGGITMPKFNANALSLGTSDTQATATLPSTAKVGELITAERSATATLTGKSIDADNNTISNLETDNFKSGVVVTSIATSSTAADTKLPTEAAVRTELDKKQDRDTDAVANNIAKFDANGTTVDSGKAFVTAIGPASGANPATDNQIPTALAVRSLVDSSASAGVHSVVRTTANDDNFQFSVDHATWTLTSPLGDHPVIKASLLDANGNEVMCNIQYTTVLDAPAVIFGINCDSAADVPDPGEYKAQLLG